MTFRGDVTKTESRARTGGGGRGGMVAGGGIGTIILALVIYALTGQNILGSVGTGPQSSEPTGSLDHCKTGEDANKYADCRVEFTAISVDRVWQKLLPDQAGIQYTQPGLVVFDNQTQSGCGTASAKTGPFYCPGDQSAYFDTAFFDQLTQFGGENAPMAQEYIVAHEFGHHIQDLEGTLSLSNYNQPGEDSNAVKIELQADCYAGIWAHHADKGDDAMLETITPEQVKSAIDTARAVGDDNIQKRSGGQVRPDMFTHGSSEQRQQAFMAGYQEGTMSACDTLGRNAYK